MRHFPKGLIIFALIFAGYYAYHHSSSVQNLLSKNGGLSVATTFHPSSGKVVVSHCDYHTGNGCGQIPPPNSCHATLLQDPHCTPGALNPAVTQQTIEQTICRRGGYTGTIRPPTSYTEPLKFKEMAAYGFSNRSASDFELDHLISLEIGGAASDPRNLWPESHEAPSFSFQKDKVENTLHTEICDHKISLQEAQYRILHWSSYRNG